MLLNTYKAPQISKMLGLTQNQIYEIKRKYNLSNKRNLEFIYNNLQSQILLSGKLGDGNYKCNTGGNYCYREFHASGEKDYIIWKMNCFSKDMITSKGLQFIDKKSNTCNNQYGFYTVTTPSLIPYANMSIENTINNLDECGLVLFLLDDGWWVDHNDKHVYNGNFNISGGLLTDNQLLQICKKLNDYNINNAHIIGNKRHDISIPSENNQRLYDIARSFIPLELDIMKKKFILFYNSYL